MVFDHQKWIKVGVSRQNEGSLCQKSTHVAKIMAFYAFGQILGQFWPNFTKFQAKIWVWGVKKNIFGQKSRFWGYGNQKKVFLDEKIFFNFFFRKNVGKKFPSARPRPARQPSQKQKLRKLRPKTGVWGLLTIKNGLKWGFLVRKRGHFARKAHTQPKLWPF